MLHKKRKTAGIVLLLVFLLALLAFLILNKKISVNGLFLGKYEMKGIDVSNYQGEIDWQEIEKQGIDFAYIKATEGSSYMDKNFENNWTKIAETDIYAGAYHFFSFESAGRTQADNYIKTVGSLEGKLVPAVDVEYYGNKSKESVNVDEIRKELKDLLVILEAEYEKKPVIYCTYKAYFDFIQGEFEEYDLWIRNVYFTPDVSLAKKWKFWQYTDKEMLNGYSGAEKYIDMNVFGGDKEEFLIYNKLD